MKRVLTMCMAALMVLFLIPSTAEAASEKVTLTVAADKETVNPGDTVNFEVRLGAVEKLGGLEFRLAVPEGLTIQYDKITIPDGLKDTLKSDGEIARPVEANNLTWAYCVGSESYTSASDLCILTFPCIVNADAASGARNVTLNIETCFDDGVGENMTLIAVDVLPAALTVKIPVTGVALDKSSLALKDGDSTKLTATVSPGNADDKTVSWSSDNTEVATVSEDGTVTAVKAGTANIVVTTRDGGKTASCAVTVECNHILTRIEATEATCGKDGNVEYYSCSKCNKNYTDGTGTKEIADVIIPATGQHGDTELRGGVAATEEKEGYTGDTYCTVCGNKIADGTVIPKLPHTHVMTRTEAVEPDCENDGNVEYYTCSKCGKKFADEAGTKELTDVVNKAKGHTGAEWLKDETGHWKVCTVCGKEFDRANHSYRWVVDKAATEDETGLAHEECDICGNRRSEGTVTDKLDHVHTGIQHFAAVAANCMTKGNVEYWTCSSEKCKDKYYGDAACQVVLEGIVTPVDSHNHVGNGKWDRTAEKHIYTCACGAVLTDETHKYGSEADADCDVCGYKRFYVVTGGADAIYEIGSENGLVITADGDYSLFKELEIDGSVVDTANYEVKEGSTVITLKKSWLDALTAKTYSVRIVYTDGKAASASFTVKAKDNNTDNNNSGNNEEGNSNGASNTQPAQEQSRTDSPKTGEGNRLAVWVVLAVSSLALIAGLLVYDRKGKKK